MQATQSNAQTQQLTLTRLTKRWNSLTATLIRTSLSFFTCKTIKTSIPFQGKKTILIHVYQIYFRDVFNLLEKKLDSPVNRLIFYLAYSPQKHIANTMGSYYLTHSVNFRRGRKPMTFGRALSYHLHSFHMRTGFESHLENLIEIQNTRGKCKWFDRFTNQTP